MLNGPRPRRRVAEAAPSISTMILLAPLLLPLAGVAGDGPPSGPLGDLGKVAERLGVEVVVGDPGFPVRIAHGPIDGEVADARALRNYARLAAPEFALYPPDLARRARLRRVVLCSALSFDGQRRNAVPDFEHDTLYLDVARGSYSKPYQRKVIHHEFFHMVDLRDDGRLYRDDRWSALNPPPFRYGSGGRDAQDLATTSVLTGEFPGFLNHYSTTAVEEDKAELFANLLVDPAHVAARAKEDRVLDAKVRRMKAGLAGFCPGLDDPFWEKVGATKRADD